ncbi:DRS1 [Acrasis kona]|uniref:DRS1 n=1 Tax=Acrasis kona TaxID=1008807 RepID=A0AAW2ZDD5_9EUKA
MIEARVCKKRIVRRTFIRYIRTSKARESRRCIVKDVRPGKTVGTTDQKYYPNYLVDNDGISMEHPKPFDNLIRDDEPQAFLSDCLEELNSAVKATGMLYVVEDRGSGKQYSTATFWILKLNDKESCRYLATVIHVCQGFDPFNTKFYVSRKDQHTDLLEAFCRGEMNRFYEVVPVKSLIHSRKNYVEKLSELQHSENLDPEYGIQPHPILDVMFLTCPNDFKVGEGLKLSQKNLDKHSFFALPGFHDVNEVAETDCYSSTMYKVPSASDLLYLNQSVSTGRIIKPGAISTVVMTAAVGSCGGPLINGRGEVFGIFIGGLSDSYHIEPELKNSDVDWDFDRTLDENKKKHTLRSRNRNLAITVQHKGFRMLIDELRSENSQC